MTKIPQADSTQLRRLYTAFAQLQTPEEVALLMSDLCTVREVNEMSQRLLVADMLAAGDAYLEIQGQTGASTTTIARVSKCLSHGSGGYRLVQDD